MSEDHGRSGKPRVLLVANTDWYLYNFRQGLARRLRTAGWEVVMVAPSGPYLERLSDQGYCVLPFDFATHSRSVARELSVLWRLIRLYRAERPDLVHHFTVKPVLYGSFAASLAGPVPVVNAVTGLGYVFTGRDFKARLLRPVAWLLYRLALSRPLREVVFQNEDDREAFIEMGLVSRSRTHVIRGSGVDCRRFRPVPPRGDTEGAVRILFASRLLWDKGVGELLEAARLLERRGVPARVFFAGDVYPGNPTSLTEEDLARIRREEPVTVLGHVEDMPALLADTDIVVLPSYSEGTPRILLEAAAMERPIVATRIPGCEGLVRHGRNGLLVDVGDARALADALERLATNEDSRREFGRMGRRIVRQEFAEEIVVDRTLEVYRELLPSTNGVAGGSLELSEPEGPACGMDEPAASVTGSQSRGRPAATSLDGAVRGGDRISSRGD